MTPNGPNSANLVPRGQLADDPFVARTELAREALEFDPMDIRARIDELKRLDVGWLDGKGIPAARDGLGWLSAAFDRHYPKDLQRPYLYPTAEGQVRAEWSIPPYELSLEIDVTARIGNWHSLCLDDDGEHTTTLKLDDESDWEWLTAEVRRASEPLE